MKGVRLVMLGRRHALKYIFKDFLKFVCTAFSVAVIKANNTAERQQSLFLSFFLFCFFLKIHT